VPADARRGQPGIIPVLHLPRVLANWRVPARLHGSGAADSGAETAITKGSFWEGKTRKQKVVDVVPRAVWVDGAKAAVD